MAVLYRSGDEEFEQFLAELNEACGDPDLEFASDTLGGIYDWCKEHGVVTDKQEEAVSNIVNAGGRSGLDD